MNVYIITQESTVLLAYSKIEDSVGFIFNGLRGKANIDRETAIEEIKEYGGCFVHITKEDGTKIIRRIEERRVI
ncbi:MAG: hypothetical protein GY799_21090 [Desulfobulbaceae bacterium]|nr:hypothetical protein [Desulfobulbaceae bacterium]